MRLSLISLIQALNAELSKKEKELSFERDTIRLWENKLEVSEEVFIKDANNSKIEKEKLADEIRLLKDSICKSQAEETNHIGSLNEAKKVLKVREKEIYNRRSRHDNSLETNKTQKENLSRLKSENKSAEKALKSEEKRFKLTQKKLESKISDLEQELLDMKSITQSDKVTSSISTSCSSKSNVSLDGKVGSKLLSSSSSKTSNSRSGSNTSNMTNLLHRPIQNPVTSQDSLTKCAPTCVPGNFATLAKLQLHPASANAAHSFDR